MAYTITQARPLLTAAELELFDQSRAGPIKELTLARLRGKVTRTRTLRDKYRDLFRRQTVSVRKAPSTKGRSPVGADNERTQRKADILQEVLARFEERVALLEAKQMRETAGTTAADRKTAKKPVAKKALAGKTAAKKTAAPRKSAAQRRAPTAAAAEPAKKATASGKKVAVAKRSSPRARKPSPAGTASPL